MNQVHWLDGTAFTLADERQPLGQVIAAAESAGRDWIVLQRWAGTAGPFYYAFQLTELKAFAVRFPDRLAARIEDALELRETRGSLTVGPDAHPDRIDVGFGQIFLPSMLRLVGLDRQGQPSAIGEIADWTGGVNDFMRNFGPSDVSFDPDMVIDLGPVRGRGASTRPEIQDVLDDLLHGNPTATPAERAKAILSAEGPAQIPIGETSIVDIRLELADGATPLLHRIATEIGLDEKIVAILSVDSRALKVVGPRRLELDPPKPGEPTLSGFEVSGLMPGPTRLAVMFRQGGTDLGTVAFDATVSAQATGDDRASGSAQAMRREESDDDVLVLLIEEERAGNRIYYGYHVYSKTLRWNYREFKSSFLIAPRGSGTAVLRYVRSIYTQILDRVLVNHEDLRVFQAELESIGADVCRQLHDPAFTPAMWGQRDRISAVQVTTQEPYIPWELLRLEHPDTREADERFFGEYGLVRSFSGRSGPRDLHAGSWRYLIGTYPLGTQAPLGAELDYLTGVLPTRGIVPQQVPATAGDLLDALKAPDFDVLHIACHGQTDLKDVERSALVISDRRTPRGVQPVTISPATVLGQARLEGREPIVFLNACESGQQAPSLTDWGGWPRAFWGAGAGAFVGTSWSVYERPASTFAQAFYDSLLGGATLSEAAVAGRAAAKALGDGSWLAYVVYGNPVARLASAGAAP
jgi:hypothetical protein